MVFTMHTVMKRSMKFMFICFFLITLVMSIFFSSCRCNGSDTISTGQSLSPNQTIVSKEGKFELGFFSPGDSRNYYVGIWYKNIPVQTVVWVLNRDDPIPYSLLNDSRLGIWNRSLYFRANSFHVEMTWPDATEAVILDTGNFVLRNASGIVWQSFDHPTDTWLPGGKVGFWIPGLVSWMNPHDPASSNYSLDMYQISQEGIGLHIKADGERVLWSSGPWQEGTFASLSDYSSFNNSYNFTYNVDSVYYGDYFVYNVYDKSAMSRIVIDYLGRMVHFGWSEARQAWIVLMPQPYSCNAYAMCGPNTICNMNHSATCRCLKGFVPRIGRDWDLSDFSNGCVRMRPLQCREDKTGFMKVTISRLPAKPESLEVRDDVCKLACSGNCSCNAYAYDSVGGCLLFMGDLLDLNSPPNNSVRADLYVKILRPGKGKGKILLAAIVAPVTTAILISIFCFYCLSPKLIIKESRRTHQNILLLDLNSNGSANEKKNQYELPIFSFCSIAASTNNFSIRNKLGEGGFGPVYKGELLNKQLVAVKRLSRRSGQGLEEFRNETELIAKLQHRNLVGILGCCIENDEKILVYEYMPNKSLDFFLFEPTIKEQLDWQKRVHIIEGIAQGLLYLHHYSRLRIVHRDLKASNILLDAEMSPKISDFGMARIFGGNNSHANTKRIVGTYGYMSPEYAIKGLFSVKSDVFAFGVMMLEIISGKKNTGFYGSKYLSLLGYAWNMWKHDRVFELIDPALEIPASSSCIPLRYIHIGLLCVQENPADRPLMSDVVAMLNNKETIIASPQHPAYTVGRTLAEAGPTHHQVEVCSINGLTVSHVEAR